MGQACCSYQPKDGQNENFGNGKTINKGNVRLHMLDAEAGAKCLAQMK
jgi:hypothetical protein